MIKVKDSLIFQMENFLLNNENDSDIDCIGIANEKTPQNASVDLGPWPYINKYFKFVSGKEGSDILNFQCQICLPLKKNISCSKKSRNGLKSHINRSHFFLANEFKKCLTDGTKVARKRPHQTVSKDSEETSCRPKQAKTLQPTIQQTLLQGSRKYSQLFIDEKVGFFLSNFAS